MHDLMRKISIEELISKRDGARLPTFPPNLKMARMLPAKILDPKEKDYKRKQATSSR
jgi:hypothetical protein